ncbi:MAG: MaoC family dehydratase N-terminal domain-containing protein [Pseudorhodobacter sp.]|nr:MaoC family dehydratase N-terminal domain-containing protein [Pseudorhodobacter sp.]
MTDTALDIDHLRQWIGRTEAAVDTVSARLVAGYLAVLDDGTPERELGDLAPLAIHWCLAPAIRPMAQLGLDGHPERGSLLPPVPLPHRMWAGGRIDLHGRFHVGDVVARKSTVRDVVLKSGRSGALCFVTLDHAFTGLQGLILTERHDIVYRAARAAGAPAPVVPRAPVARWSYSVMADPVLLFRYSALTFNGHRIHYDRDHAIRSEGYAGLDGPLQATIMLEYAAQLRGAALVGLQ